MTLPGRGAPRGTGAVRAAAWRGRGPAEQLHALPASRLASVELQQEIAEQLLELGGLCQGYSARARVRVRIRVRVGAVAGWAACWLSPFPSKHVQLALGKRRHR